tara:strand:+ start:3385 stop:3582 length:198 start_codon:yes stop_codon:yes gene_type:complete
MSEKLPKCLGNTYRVKYRGVEPHDVLFYEGQLSEVNHLGQVLFFIFDTNGFILNANKIESLEKVE